MIPHSNTLAWKIPWTEEPGRLQSMGLLNSDTTERLHFHFSLSCIGEGNGNPLQCSCLENPRDGEAWWAAIYGVAQSRTRLKRLSSIVKIGGKKPGKTTRPVRYKLNQIPYKYVVKVMNRFKGLDLVNSEPELGTEVCNTLQEQWTKPSQGKRKARRQMIIWGFFTNSWRKKWKAREKGKDIPN